MYERLDSQTTLEMLKAKKAKLIGIFKQNNKHTQMKTEKNQREENGKAASVRYPNYTKSKNIVKQPLLEE